MLPAWIVLTAAFAAEPELTEPEAATPPPSVSVPPPIRLLYTGGSGGIGSGTYRFTLLDRLTPRLSDADVSIDAIRAHHGAMAQGSWLLLANDRRVETLLPFLEGGAVTCEPPRASAALRTRTEVLLLDPEGAAELSSLLAGETAPAEVRACRAGEAKAWLAGPVDAGLPDDWSRFEFRLAMQLLTTAEGRTNLAEVVGLPDEEAARRIAVLADLREAHPDALFVDGGSFVDGTSSVRDNALSLHRPTGFAALRRLDPTALVPGRTELAGGARALREEGEGLPYIAANWVAADAELGVPPSLVAEVDGVRVGFVGAVDPDVAAWVPQLATEGITLTDPLPAVQAAVDALRAGEPPADVVVVLTEIDGPGLRALQQRLVGVDLVIGDTAPEDDRIRAIDVDLRAARMPDPPPAYTLPVDGIGYAELDVRDALTGVRVEPQPVPVTLAPDLDVLRRVNAVRAAEYPPLDRPILPAAPDAPTAPLPHDTWEKIVCEAVLAYTSADLALLPDLPRSATIPGPLTELLLVDRLAMLDVLEIHEVTGEALPRMLNKAFQVVPVACGAPLGEKAPKIAGRSVEPDRIYRVVTTDRLRTDAATEGLVTEGRPSRLLDLPNHRTVRDDTGAPVTLRRAVLSELRALRDTEDDNVVAVLSARSPADRPPQWVLRARPISFSVERFEGADDAAFAEIPETLATSPSSFTLSTNDDVQLEYSSRKIIWDARVRALFTQLTTEDDTSEPADDLKLSTSASLPGAALPISAGFAPMPFAEALYDSEFTPIENEEDGSVLPLQRDLSLTLGLSGSAGLLQTVRVGGFALKDLSVIDKPLEYGGRTEIYARVGFGPGLYWGNLLDAYVWVDTPEADASDLRFKALLDSRVELPIAWWLNMAVYGRGFLFQGRVPETDRLGASFTVGAALDFSGAFVL